MHFTNFQIAKKNKELSRRKLEQTSKPSFPSPASIRKPWSSFPNPNSESKPASHLRCGNTC